MKKANWMKQYSQLIVKAKPEMAGKIDWNTATFLFNSGLTVEQAVAKILG